MGIGILGGLTTGQRSREEERLRQRKSGRFPGQTLSQSAFIQAGVPGKLDFFGNLIPRETGRLRRSLADRSEGVRGQRVDPGRFIPGKRRTFEAERVPRGTALLEVAQQSLFFAPAVIGRRSFLERQRDISKRLAALDPTVTRDQQFLAGRGFSLQPLGFNLALSQFQNPELFNFENRRAGGFLVGGSEEESGRFRRKRTRQRIPLPPSNVPVPQGDFRGEATPGQTLLTGRIRRQKLTPGGTVRPLEAVTIVAARRRVDTTPGPGPNTFRPVRLDPRQR